MNNLLTCQNVTKKYGGKVALTDVSLTLEAGHIYGLLGPNGSGKTTLIKLINGLLTPTQGQILVQGGPIGPASKAVISYLPDHTYLNGWMKVRDIIRFFVDFYPDFSADRAYEMLKSLDINAGDKLKTMSKGTKEKVQLILVMSRKAKLYVLDEPIAGVDPAARDYIMNTILTNYDPEASILISTHLISDIENILDRVIFLQNGQITVQDSVENIREQRGMSVDQYFRETFRY